MLKPSHIVMLLALLQIPSLLIAQSTDDFISESDFLDELPVILSATRLSQPQKDAPQAMSIIKQDLIQASGAQTIADVLRLVPGFQVGQVTGSVPTVTYHGMSDRYARNMQVLVDGRSVYDAGFGGVAWASLPLSLDDISRIEVSRGPNAASFGANAFSATINIISKHPSEQLGTRSKLVLGNKQTQQLELSHAQQNGKLDYRLSLRHKASSGLVSRFDDYKLSQFSFRSDYQFSLSDKLLFQADYSSSRQDDGFNIFPASPDTVYQPERSVDYRMNSQQIKWRHILGNENEMSLQFYHNHQDINDDFQTMLFSEFDPDLPLLIDALFNEPDQRLNLGNSIGSHRFDLEFQHNLRLNPDWRMSWGLGTRLDSAFSQSMFATDDSFKRRQLRSFLNAEWYVQNDMVINVGGMYENYRDFKPLLSPRLAINYHLHPQHTLRISATQAYRMPTLVESNVDNRAFFQNGRTFDFVSTSSNPQPERIRSYEIGYIGQSTDYNLQWDIKLFRDEQNNLIYQPKDNTCLEVLDGADSVCDAFDSIGVADYRGAYNYQNAGNSTIHGLELSSQWQVSSQTTLHVAYSYADSSSQLLRNANSTELTTKTKQTPKQTYNAMLQHQWANKLNSSLIFYYQDDMKWQGEGNFNPSYQRIDARLSKRYKIHQYQAEVNLVIQNIGADYIDFQKENIIDTSAFAEFKLFVE